MTLPDRPAARWAAAAGWAGTIYLLSDQSHPPPAAARPPWDKLEHAAAYALLALLLARAWLPILRRRLRASKVRWAAVILTVFAYGISDELHQSFVPNRSCETLDAAADLTGAVLTALIFGVWLRRWRGTRRLGLE